ncbi:MAG TPA: hypothetical protein VIR63_02850, partial [Pontiella sp.]
MKKSLLCILVVLLAGGMPAKAQKVKVQSKKEPAGKAMKDVQAKHQCPTAECVATCAEKNADKSRGKTIEGKAEE